MWPLPGLSNDMLEETKLIYYIVYVGHTVLQRSAEKMFDYSGANLTVKLFMSSHLLSKFEVPLSTLSEVMAR